MAQSGHALAIAVAMVTAIPESDRTASVYEDAAHAANEWLFQWRVTGRASTDEVLPQLAKYFGVNYWNFT